MTQRRKPRAAPNRKPSERSSAPTFESRIASDRLMVMIETTTSAMKKMIVAAAIESPGSFEM